MTLRSGIRAGALAALDATAITVAGWQPGRSARGEQASEVRQVERALHMYFDAFVSKNRDSIRSVTTPDFVLIENGYPVGMERFTETWNAKQSLRQRYE